MKRHENKKDEELQRNIEEQEHAMSALLLRVMERPLVPLHKSLDELREQLAAVQQANTKAAQVVEAGLSEALDGQGKRLNRYFGDVADGIDGLKKELGTLASTLDTHHIGQAERNERMQDSLHRADGILAQLEAKADAAGTAIAATAQHLTKVDDAIGAVHAQQQAGADQLSHELDGMGLRLEQRHAHLDNGLVKTGTMLEQLDIKARATSDSLAAAAHVVAKLDADLGAMREQEHTTAGQLNRGVSGLTQQLDRQQAQLCERISALRPELAPHFEALAVTIDGSAKEVARQYQALPEIHEALVTATVKEQLALQLIPFQIRAKWLFAVCGLSCASTLTLLGMKLFA
jgi:DNA repair exonuclease SbcCD ATPase subunit